VRFIYKKISL